MCCYCPLFQAVDVFAAFSTSLKNRLSVMKEIAKLWKVPVSSAETLYPHDKPIIQVLSSELCIPMTMLFLACISFSFLMLKCRILLQI